MDDNQIIQLKNGTFGVTKVKYLSFANNQITLIEAGALPGMNTVQQYQLVNIFLLLVFMLCIRY
jgi:hypothetical protein